MRQLTLRAAAGLALVFAPAVGAFAQMGWTPGSEIVGQTLQVQTNGSTNSVTFNADGSATIMTPGGMATPATWSAANNQLCLSAGGPQECWPYTQAFQAGQQMALTSNCRQVSTWMASMTNQPPPLPQPMGERG
ncbi:MAG: hypothetical protein WKF52_00555 [Sphingomicrobium sp.]